MMTDKAINWSRLPCSRAVGRTRTSGFTLIELMIVVAVVAILAGAAIAAYDWATVKSRRNSAAACTLESAQLVERFYTTRLTYTGAPGPGGDCVTQLTGHYGFALNVAADGRSYTITATPENAQQTKDTECAALSIDQTGQKTTTGTGSPQDCW